MHGLLGDGLPRGGLLGRPVRPNFMRPFAVGEYVDNGNGTRSTERTVTVSLPTGQWVNIPSLWMTQNGPVDFGDNNDAAWDAARAYEKQSGLMFPRFKTMNEGVSSSILRSKLGGVFSGLAAKPMGIFDPRQVGRR